jgi:uncharacterized protein YndB with AHSA1/START domain
MPVKNKSNDIKITRLYSAPVKAVWDAWTDPDQAAKWWGPRGFSTTTESKDVRTGGHWKYVMRGPDGTEWPTTTKYLEVIEHSKLVYDHGGNDDTPPLFRVTVIFSEAGDKTRMDMTMTCPSPEAKEKSLKIIKNAGGNSTWDRLEEHLQKKLHDSEKFILNRSFKCSKETMFEIWTSPDKISNWMAPAGCEMQFLKCDITPGGVNHYCMTVPGGQKMYGKTQYLTISKPDQIVYLQQFSDENENVTRHPMSATWPETMKTTIEFASEESEDNNKQCRVTITWECHEPTKEELDTFVEGRAGMTQGWTGSLDKLEEYVDGLGQK